MSKVAVVDLGIATYSNAHVSFWRPLLVRLLEEGQGGGYHQAIEDIIPILKENIEDPTTIIEIINEMALKNQPFKFGAVRAVSSALPDHNKNHVLEASLLAPANPEEKGRNRRTDVNRTAYAHGFLEGSADWLLNMEDDVNPPKGFIQRLLQARRPFIGGLVFHSQEPFTPTIYTKLENGMYHAITEFVPGSLLEVDSMGMGCTMIHRSVFEKIMDEFELFQRPNGTLQPVHKSRVKKRGHARLQQIEVRNGVLKTPVVSPDPDDKRPWPFFAMEYARTEDHYFCEMAAEVGIRPYADTTILCGHNKVKPFGRDEHKAYMEENYYGTQN